MAAWRTFAAHRLSGNDTFQVTDALNFPPAGTWEQALQTLQRTQHDLVEAIKNFPESKLDTLVPGTEHKYTYYTLLHGVIQHDIYHLGQIAILNKVLSAQADHFAPDE